MPRYSWNAVKVCVKHQSIEPLIPILLYISVLVFHAQLVLWSWYNWKIAESEDEYQLQMCIKTCRKLNEEIIIITKTVQKNIQNIIFGVFWKKSLKISKGVIRICKSTDRQHNGQMKKDKITNNDLQNTTQKTRDRAKRIPQKTRDELMCSRRINSFCSTSDTCHVTLVTNPLNMPHLLLMENSA